MLGKGYASNNFGKQPSSFEGNLAHENSEIPHSDDSYRSNFMDLPRLPKGKLCLKLCWVYYFRMLYCNLIYDTWLVYITHSTYLIDSSFVFINICCDIVNR